MAKKEKVVYPKVPLPGKLRIAVAEYTILHSPAKEIMKKDSDGDYPMGEYKAREATIAVDAEMPPMRQLETYVHETVHLIFYEAGLYAENQDHKLINPVAIILTRLLLENDFGWMHKWYLEQQKKV